MRSKLVSYLAAAALIAAIPPTDSSAQSCRSAPPGSRYSVYYVGGGCGAPTTAPLIGWNWFRFTVNGVPNPPFAVAAFDLNNGATLFNAFRAAATAPGVLPGGLQFGEYGCNGCELPMPGPPFALMNARQFILYADLRDLNEYRLEWAPNVPALDPTPVAPGPWAIIAINTAQAPWPGGAPLHAPGPDCQPCIGGPSISSGPAAQSDPAPSADFLGLIEEGTVPFGDEAAIPTLSGWGMAVLAALLLSLGLARLRRRSSAPPPA